MRGDVGLILPIRKTPVARKTRSAVQINTVGQEMNVSPNAALTLLLNAALARPAVIVVVVCLRESVSTTMIVTRRPTS